jgi:hypothetical protein
VFRFFISTAIAVLLWAFSAPGWAAEVSREQIKGLDEQVQEIKSDALGIAADLNRLEEKLLYPSSSQLAVFVSLAPGAKFRLDAVEIQIDGKTVAHYLYALKELEALQRGGVQRIYAGNIRNGDHNLQVSVIGKSAGGADYRNSASFKVTKDVAPKLVGVTLAAPGSANQGISLKDW